MVMYYCSVESRNPIAFVGCVGSESWLVGLDFKTWTRVWGNNAVLSKFSRNYILKSIRIAFKYLVSKTFQTKVPIVPKILYYYKDPLFTSGFLNIDFISPDLARIRWVVMNTMIDPARLTAQHYKFVYFMLFLNRHQLVILKIPSIMRLQPYCSKTAEPQLEWT